MKRITLHPGEHIASDQQCVISTLLGSCVSACLYDPRNKIVGMNHFLLANRRYARDIPLCLTEAGKYGVHAMELVINGMITLGASRKNLHAKVFGGGSVLGSPDSKDNFFCVGEVNCRFILQFLQNEGIPLVASDLGGNIGRTIRFVSDDYSVYVKKIGKTGTRELAIGEKEFWRRSIEDHKRSHAEPEMWD
jgi:chemotaxis protein CheD